MTLQSAITFFIAIFIFSVTPGPGVFAIIGRSMMRGAKNSVALCVGMALSDIVYLIMACYGLAAIAAQWETAFLLVRYLGAAYLIYLGWKMWTSPVSNGDEATSKNTTNGLASFLQGFMISASNPKVIVFYIAFLPNFLDVTTLHGMDVLLAAVIAFTALLLGLSIVSVGASQARRYMKSEKAMKGLNRSAGSIMALAGCYLGLKG
ncbi:MULTISPECIES: LysE family translocator [Marinomonas]|uniref:LysE family translocator n=1 Tax=Marinomonas TaxID=28253 RepID=UPI001056696B|nr:LysE family translocator [Marinomonas sp. KMM3893]